MNSSAFDGLEPAAMVTLLMLSLEPDADVPEAVPPELEQAATRRAAEISSIAGKRCLRPRRLIGPDFIEPLLGGVCRRPRWALGDPPLGLPLSCQPRDMQSTVDRSLWSRLGTPPHRAAQCE